MGLFDQVRDIRHDPMDVVIAGGIVIVGVPVMLLSAAALGVYLYFFAFPPPVSIPEIKAATAARTSHIYGGDGSLFASLHAEQNREPLKFAKMPRRVVNAVLAAEDERYYKHRGLDLKSILRALTADARAGGTVQGGSTITQQYVKNAFTGNERSFFRKIREAQVASQLEKTYSKNIILERYLNTVYFGRGAYGIGAASKSFFAKPPSKLTVSEAALLAGLIPSPGKFSPDRFPAEASRRRTYVIDRMEKLNFITTSEASVARSEQPKLAEVESTEEVFRFPWFVDAVKRHLLDKYGRDKVYNGGLEVYGTLDPAMQEAAEKSIREALPSETDPYSSIVTIEPATGFVKAIVGGRDYEKEKYNIAIQSRRQTGSAFKPFVLAAAIEAGVLPSDTYSGPSKYCEIRDYRSKDGCIHNFENQGFGSISVEQATVNSVNTVYIQLAQKVGIQRLIETSRRMGISERTLEKDKNNIAIALGGFTEGVTPLEMSSGFATLAARGIYRAPKFVTKVVDTNGKILESGPSKPVKALDQDIADNITAILAKVVTSGTGRRADIGRPAAGKTGSAQDFRNAWFVGYTPELSTAVWVGYKETNRELLNVRGVKEVTGGTIPAQIWSAYMKVATAASFPAGFAEPEALGSLELPFKASPTPGFEPNPSEDPGTYPPGTFPTYEPSLEPSPTPSRGILGDLFGGN
ncbi:MAG: transglycosylase domain-containing protein [Actinomycetota bacterium]